MLSIFSILACGRDPILDRVDEMTKPSEDVSSKKDMPSSSSQTNLKPDDVESQSSPQSRHEPSSPDKNDGPKITISGRIVAANCPDGPIRLNVSDGDQSEANDRKINVIADKMNLKPGPFSIQVSPQTSQLYLDAFCDADKDGSPGASDPKGVLKTPLQGDQDHSDILLSLTSPTSE